MRSRHFTLTSSSGKAINILDMILISCARTASDYLLRILQTLANRRSATYISCFRLYVKCKQFTQDGNEPTSISIHDRNFRVSTIRRRRDGLGRTPAVYDLDHCFALDARLTSRCPRCSVVQGAVMPPLLHYRQHPLFTSQAAKEANGLLGRRWHDFFLAEANV